MPLSTPVLARDLNVKDPAYGAKGDAVNLLISTNATTTVTLAAGFAATADMVGKSIQADQDIPAGTTVSSVNVGAGTLTLSAAATGTHSNVDADVGTDDTAAIQAAHDALPEGLGGRVFFPQGRYLVSDADADGAAIVITKDEVTFEGVNSGFRSWLFSGALPTNPQGHGGSVLVTHRDIALVRVWRKTIATVDQGAIGGWHIEKLGFRGGAYGGGSGGPATLATVGIDTKTDTASAIPSDGGCVTHCMFIKVKTAMTFARDDSLNVENNWIGESGGGVTYTDPAAGSNVTLFPKFVGNGFYDIGGNSGGGVGVSCDYGGGAVVANNRFVRCTNAIVFGANQLNSIAIGNTILDPFPVSGSAIFLKGIRCNTVGNVIVQRQASPTGTGVNCSGAPAAAHQVIADNTIVGFRYGIYVTSTFARVNNNTITGQLRHGIYVDLCSDSEIHNNVLTQNGLETDATYDHIFIDNNSDNNSVQGNVCRKINTASPRARYGIRVNAATCDANYVTNNDLLTAGQTGGLSDAGTSTVTTAGNRAP